jgi:hypothetical protein
MVLVKLRDAIEFSDGCSMNTPYLARQLSLFYRHAHRGITPRW